MGYYMYFLIFLSTALNKVQCHNSCSEEENKVKFPFCFSKFILSLFKGTWSNRPSITYDTGRAVPTKRYTNPAVQIREMFVLLSCYGQRQVIQGQKGISEILSPSKAALPVPFIMMPVSRKIVLDGVKQAKKSLSKWTVLYFIFKACWHLIWKVHITRKKVSDYEVMLMQLLVIIIL